MKVLVLGSGGREHALVEMLADSPSEPTVYAWPGNDAIGEVARLLSASGVEDVPERCLKEGIDLCVVGPEFFLAEGIADSCARAGIDCWGPTASASRLETSKLFANRFMRRHDIPTPEFARADTPEGVRSRIERYPVVLKYDGLAGGKGVTVCESSDDVDEYLRDVFCERRFGSPGAIVIEECLEGEEVSVIASVVDGEAHLFPAVRDYKRLLEGGEGPNTGGMGAIANPDLLSETRMRGISSRIIEPTLEGLCEEGLNYRGFLYFGLMLTDDGPFVLEYNCRFGDPEAQAVAPLLVGDFASYLHRAARGELCEELIEFRDRWSVVVTLAAANYPRGASRGETISGLDSVEENADRCVYHAATAYHPTRPDAYVTDGGRILSAVGAAPGRARATDIAYELANSIRFPGKQYRPDIGK